MDKDPPLPPSSTPKKPKFTPKPPPRRKTGTVLPKNEANEDDGEITQALLRKANERLGTRGRKGEKKSSGNVTESHGAGSSPTPVRTYGQLKDGNSENSSNLRGSAEQGIVLSSSTATKDGDIDEMLVDDELESSSKTKNEYREPWDYQSNYPISLPWRIPYSGDPELLDKQEFGEEKEHEHEHDENKINSALELGLLENDEKQQMILFKLPSSLPLEKQTDQIPVGSKGKEKVESSGSSKEDASNRFCGLKELPNGYMGKMLVYKSGAVKLKLGDSIFDVLSGTPRAFAQDAAVMNTGKKNCCNLGELRKHAVLIPDLNSVLDNINLR